MIAGYAVQTKPLDASWLRKRKAKKRIRLNVKTGTKTYQPLLTDVNPRMSWQNT